MGEDSEKPINDDMPADMFDSLIEGQSTQDLFDRIKGPGCVTINKHNDDMEEYKAFFCKCMTDECNKGSLIESSTTIQASSLSFTLFLTLFLKNWILI